MIDKEKVVELVEQAIAGTDAYVVDVTVSGDNDIVVELDASTGVDLDFCTEVSRKLNEALDRDVEDYSLEVGSASLSAPFKVRQQYEKHIGDDVDVLTRDGRKLKGTLTSVSADGAEFTIEITRKVKEPGAKRPVMVTEPLTLAVADCKQVTYHFDFK
ncbi:MAG: ribosome assembly cofactor RimP [Duncaniella sp.]|nr:ribosome assembly cofactor RimP [Bacteroides sp.]MDE6038263.1 ribosome assembly cofactor RimP [Duncaniella sp.]